ncbi:putative methyltransferase-domain-containing protein [Flammula alnicola]|nr:putative methyltransferase-domain-containing protein [Flammula alnicola]
MVTKGPVVLSDDCERVTDADEEVFVLYSELLSNRVSDNPNGFRGLGYVDSHKDVLEIKFELQNVLPPATAAISPTGNRRPKPRKVAQCMEKTIEVELLQDKTALHSRKGDTGSVLWKASIDFGQLVLQQYYSGSTPSILNRDILHTQHVLELGAGTGLLSIALSPLVRNYTATDIGPLIPLIQKNVALNFPGWPANPSAGEKGKNVSVEQLDWIAIESASTSQRVKIYNTEDQPIDLLLAVDCIYHPSLIPPFLTTVDHLTNSGRTAVLVVSELRAADVMREFLESWLSKPGWEIWHMPNNLLGKNYVIWLGWKTENP